MKTFKFRAEALHDTLIFLCLMPKIEYVEFGGLYDGTFTFKTNMSLEELREVWRKVPDGHVALQTIQPIEKFTGERDMDLR